MNSKRATISGMFGLLALISTMFGVLLMFLTGSPLAFYLMLLMFPFGLMAFFTAPGPHTIDVNNLPQPRPFNNVVIVLNQSTPHLEQQLRYF
jgi:hypothetical protein